MVTETTQGKNLNVRVDQKLISRFKKLCGSLDLDQSALVREMIEAVVENRLTIQPRQGQRTLIQGIHKG